MRCGVDLTMNLRQLRYFLAVAELLHFGRAAQRLNMAQPPLSQQIKQLEVELGVQLFERTKRRVRLTEAGSALRAEAQQILTQVEAARKRVQQVARGETGRLVIAFVSSAMYSVLPPWISAFRQRYPKVVLSFEEATSLEQMEGLRSRQIDVGFVHPPIVDDEMASRVVWREPMVAVLSKGHPLSSGKGVAIAQLAKEPFVLMQRPLSGGLYDKVVDFCRQAGFSPMVVQCAPQLQTIMGLVAAKLGVSILPAAAKKLKREDVCYRPFVEKTPTVELVMVWRQDETSTVVKNFVDSYGDVLLE